ncbi:MAG TPA: Fic family protein [Candidatus Krumholzibacteria bacterium]
MIYEVPEVGAADVAALEKIEDLKRQLRFRVTEPRRWLGSVRRVLSARAIRGSNSIEGFDVSVEDALAALEGEEPVEAQERDWLAVLGYRRAMTYVLQLGHDQHFEYSSSLIRSLHFMMTEYTLDAGPGLWRPGPIWVRNEASGEIVYEAPESEEVPALVEELVDQLKAYEDSPPMVRGAMAHLNLAMIHPFRDGNGRMARCLQTLALAREQILSPEWMSIEEFLGANTQSYYDVLAEVGKGAWQPEGDARPWIRYCLRAHYIQAVSVLRRVRESEGIWVAIDELREKRGLPERSISSLFDAAIGLRIRNASHRKAVELTELTEISNQVATNDLRKMVQAGLVAQRGSKRGTYYVAADSLVAVRERVRADRQPIDAGSLFDA